MNGIVKIKISPDMMEALASIADGDNEITEEYVMEELDKAGVNIGIIEANIKNLILSKRKNDWMVVAEGKKPGETIPGYFEFFFDSTKGKQKTRINDDGTVNYNRERVMVNEGEKIAEYHRPVTGNFGYTVQSAVIAPKLVKEPVMRPGKGVRQEEDIYYAELSGEVVIADNKITVNKTLVIRGNAKNGIDSGTEYVGDIHVQGDVLSGVKLQANGSIFVDGSVEGCVLTAGGDIVVHGSINGAYKAMITAGGTITCPIIQNATVNAGEKIVADYVMNAKLNSKGDIVVEGKHGSIIGGVATARNTFVANVLGNATGVDTKVNIVNEDEGSLPYSKIMVLQTVFENVFAEINGNRCGQLELNKEYHLDVGKIEVCQPGRFVSKRIEVKEEEPRKTILLVDDEPIILKTFFGFLKEEYDIMISTNGKEALKQLENKIPDLILLDYKMPVMDGAELLKEIRTSEGKKYTNIPVIFVTASSDKQTILKCMSLYPQGYLTKPLEQADLVNAVNKFFMKNA